MFFKKSLLCLNTLLNCLIQMNNTLINEKKKQNICSFEYYIFYRKKLRKKIILSSLGSSTSGLSRRSWTARRPCAMQNPTCGSAHSAVSMYAKNVISTQGWGAGAGAA